MEVDLSSLTRNSRAVARSGARGLELMLVTAAVVGITLGLPGGLTRLVVGANPELIVVGMIAGGAILGYWSVPALGRYTAMRLETLDEPHEEGADDQQHERGRE